MHAQETKCMTEIAVMNGEFTNCTMYVTFHGMGK